MLSGCASNDAKKRNTPSVAELLCSRPIPLRSSGHAAAQHLHHARACNQDHCSHSRNRTWTPAEVSPQHAKNLPSRASRHVCQNKLAIEHTTTPAIPGSGCGAVRLGIAEAAQGCLQGRSACGVQVWSAMYGALCRLPEQNEGEMHEEGKLRVPAVATEPPFNGTCAVRS